MSNQGSCNREVKLVILIAVRKNEFGQRINQTYQKR